MTLPQEATASLSVQLTVTLSGDVLDLAAEGSSGEMTVEFAPGESQVRSDTGKFCSTAHMHINILKKVQHDSPA